MKKITYSKASAFVMFGMLYDLFIRSCRDSAILYFILYIMNFDMSYGRCFISVVLVLSIYQGIQTFLNRNIISASIEKTVDEINKESEYIIKFPLKQSIETGGWIKVIFPYDTTLPVITLVLSLTKPFTALRSP